MEPLKMTCKQEDWLIQIKLNTWRKGHVDGVGYVMLERFDYWTREPIPFAEDDNLHLWGIALASQLRLIKLVNLAYSKPHKLSEYRLWMAVRDVFNGGWNIQTYRLFCDKREHWIRELRGELSRKSNIRAYQISKSNPFELKDRGNYKVFGRELPKARRFKS